MMSTPRTARSATLLLIAATAAACSDVAGPDAAGTSTPATARAALAATTQSITLVSGGSSFTSFDGATQFSATRGGTYQNAPIVAGDPAYSTIPGTRYVSSDPSSNGPVNGSVWYRTSFTLPAACSDLRLAVQLHADNAAAVYLNGTKIGEQPRAEIFPNFQDPAESYSTSDPALFLCGATNVLEFELYNFNNPTALDYEAVVAPVLAQTITFTSTPPSPALLGGTYAVSATGGGSGNAVTFTSLTPSVCSVAGGVVSLDVIGTCTIGADQAGGPWYHAAPRATQSFAVVWPFGGFTSPVAGTPALNSARAGQGVPLKFSLGDDRGLAILAAGYPTSAPMSCDASTVSILVDETDTAGSSTLTYDPTTGLYSYVWKTDRAWAGTCRRLTLRLNDGAEYVAYFSFRR